MHQSQRAMVGSSFRRNFAYCCATFIVRLFSNLAPNNWPNNFSRSFTVFSCSLAMWAFYYTYCFSAVGVIGLFGYYIDDGRSTLRSRCLKRSFYGWDTVMKVAQNFCLDSWASFDFHFCLLDTSPMSLMKRCDISSSAFVTWLDPLTTTCMGFPIISKRSLLKD